MSNATNNAHNAFSNLGNKLSGAFNTVKSSLNEVKTSIQDMSGALLGITAGGAVSGLAWLSKAKSNLYVSEMKEAIESNKKLGVSFEYLKKSASDQAALGLGTTSSNMKGAYAEIMAGDKYLGKRGQNKVDQVSAIENFWYSRKEMMEEEGISSPEMLIKRLTLQSGDISKGMRGKQLSAALGIELSDSSMNTAQKRINSLVAKGSKVDLKAQLDLRPWDVLDSRISQLKGAIGDSIAGPMTFVTELVANLVTFIAKIPGGAAIIGLSGMFLALASALSIVIGIMTPLWNLMKAHNVLTAISTLLKTSEASATVADAGAQAMLTGAMEGEFAATELTTAAQNVSLATRLRLIGAKVWETAATYASSVANFLGIGSLLGLAAAEGIAATGAYALAAGVWAFLSPLLPFIAAGAILVGILALIADKLGILQPIITSVKKAFSGDFGGAWKTLTNIKLPTLDVAISGIKDVFTGIFTGTTFFAVITKLLGVPLYKIIDFVEQIRDLLKKVRDFIDYIIGLFRTYIYMPLKGIWDFVARIVEYIFGKEGATGAALAEKINKAIYDEARQNRLDPTKSHGTGYFGESWADDSFAEKRAYVANAAAGLDYYQNAEGKRQFSATDLGTGWTKLTTRDMVVSQSYIDAAKKLGGEVSGAKKGVAAKAMDVGAANDAGLAAAKDTFDKSIEDTTDKLAKGVPASAAAGDAGSPLKALGYAWDYLGGVYDYYANDGGIKQAASGGQVTKEGLLYVHGNEPIIPAELSQNSNLINVLSTIAGNSNNNNGPTIIINMDYKTSGPGTGNGRYLDDFAFERAVKTIIGKCIRTYGSY